MLSGCSQWLLIWPPNFSGGPLSFRDLMVFQNLNWKKNFINFEIINPVIGCCQSTLKGNAVFHARTLYAVFRELSKIKRIGGSLNAFIFQILCFLSVLLCTLASFCVVYAGLNLERINLPFTRACHTIAIDWALLFSNRPIYRHIQQFSNPLNCTKKDFFYTQFFRTPNFFSWFKKIS